MISLNRIFSKGLMLWFFFLAGPAMLQSQDDLSQLSEEFDQEQAVDRFKRIYMEEGWGAGANKLEVMEANGASEGRLVMVPYTSSWYQDYVGILAFKPIVGDFVVTTEVIPRHRSGTGPPSGLYSLAGIMVRAPSGLTNGLQGWRTGRQNYVFLSMGAGNRSNAYQFEVKTTINSSSTLIVTDAAVSQAEIQVARLGDALIMLRRDQGGSWQIHRRYLRADFPQTLQVGLTVYTDWDGLQAVYPFGQEAQHNASVIRSQNPGLHAEFEYLRFQRPVIPDALADRDFMNPAEVSDAQLLSFLGSHANLVIVVPTIEARFDHPRPEDLALLTTEGFPLRIIGESGTSFSIQWSENLIHWQSLTSLVGNGELNFITDEEAINHSNRFYRIAR